MNGIEQLIQGALAHKAEKIISEEIVEAQKRISDRLRSSIGEIVASVASHFDYQQMQDVVTIRVQLPEIKQ